MKNDRYCIVFDGTNVVVGTYNSEEEAQRDLNRTPYDGSIQKIVPVTTIEYFEYFKLMQPEEEKEEVNEEQPATQN